MSYKKRSALIKKREKWMKEESKYDAERDKNLLKNIARIFSPK